MKSVAAPENIHGDLMVRTVRVFLSSPGDVSTERQQVRDLLLGLARGPFVRDRVHIDVVSWDDPHAPAQMDARFTPQQAVDRSLPMPAECDLTVLLLWGRMGTPLIQKKPDGTPYLSGTEWEFENALSADKPVFVYRRTDKVLIDADDADAADKLAQKGRVDAFFKRLVEQGGAIHRATATYASVDELKTRLRQDVDAYLKRVLDESAGGVDRQPQRTSDDEVRKGAGGSTKPEVPVAYREWVKKQCGGVDLLGLHLKKSRPPSLSAIYVPLETSASGLAISVPRTPDNLSRGWRRKGFIRTLLSRIHKKLALSRLANESLYLSGAPGTGKSTFCRWVVWLVAEGALPSVDVPPSDDCAESLDAGLKGRLPILLRLREFWESLPPRVGLTISDLEEAIDRWVDRKRPDALDAGLLRAHLAHGSTLLVLDGMDEVPRSSRTSMGSWHPRQQLLAALADACPVWIEAGNRILLTSRPYGLSAEQAAKTTLASAPIEPLSRELQGLLAHRWFAILASDSQAGRQTTTELFANIDSRPWLGELAANPLLLTAMCIVFDEGRRLPHDVHELYERVVATVLFSRYQTPAEIDQAKRELGVIAFGMHTGEGLDEDRATPRADATFYEMERWLQDYRQLKDYSYRSEATAFDARDALLSQSGLLLSSGEDRAEFAHQSFQEFFAAQRSFVVDEVRLVELFLHRAATPEWRNTLSFLFGRLVATFPEPKKAIDLFEALLKRATENDAGLVLVLVDAAQVLSGKKVVPRAESLLRLQRILLDVMRGAAPLKVRAEAASGLGRLGDPRFRADRWWLPDEELLGFIEVKAGAFHMGFGAANGRSSQGEDENKNTVNLPLYYVSRYLVTVAQFRAFVNDAKFSVQAVDYIRSVANHPVAEVTFHEAVAYCRWLTDKLMSEDWTPSILRERLAEGWVISLPSEAQWEKAARDDDGRLYPWGADFDASKANCLDSGMGATTPVGLFPEGASPLGCLDMSGNVAEWTRNLFDGKYRSYAYDPEYLAGETLDAPDDVLRTRRGGSFEGTDSDLRVDSRAGQAPNYATPEVGFRTVLCRPRPSPSPIIDPQ